MEVIEFHQIIERGSALDILKETVVAPIKGIGIEEQSENIDIFTGDLRRLVGWWQNESIIFIAMEKRHLLETCVFGTGKILLDPGI